MPDFSAPLHSSHTLSHFHNQVDLVTTEPAWNREPNRQPHLVNLSDSLRFKNAKTTPEKTERVARENNQRVAPENKHILVKTRDFL
ncbi:MAG: hypothetical protein ACRC8Y_08235 [Chroococcales cyanobacterium]